MRSFRLALVAAFVSLAACAQSGSGLVPGDGTASAAKAPLAKGPAFAITIVLPANVRSHGTTATVNSLKATTYIGAKRYIDIVNALPGGCHASDAGGFGGCGIALDGTSSYNLKRATFVFYSKSGAKGCALAKGELKSVTIPPGPVGVTMKAANKKTCW